MQSYCTSPFSESKIASGRVVWNLEKMILRLVIRGTARNAPTIPQRLPQKSKERRITKPLKFNRLPTSFGSRKFHVMVWGISKAPKRKKEYTGELNWINEYKNGRESAIIPQIFGIKSSRNTTSAKKRAYSIPKKRITM